MKFLYDHIAYIGRFNPFHIGHIHVCKQSSKKAKHLILLVGSAFASPSIRNPFSFEMRRQIISDALIANNIKSFTILPVPDFFYNDDSWIAHIHKLVSTVAAPSSKIALTGHKRDHTSYYLDLFPGWAFEPVEELEGFNATAIRNKYFGKEDMSSVWNLVDPTTEQTLKKFAKTASFKNLEEEFEVVAQGKASWANSPYPPVFVTTDAVVTCLGKLLVIERKFHPGKGLLALPGGFIGQNETLEDGCLRELREETKIKVPLPVLKGSIVGKGVFDHPLRSVRGRTITHAFYIQLKDTTLPKIKAADDAAKVIWAPLSDVSEHPEKFFEDHGQIVESFTGRRT